MRLVKVIFSFFFFFVFNLRVPAIAVGERGGTKRKHEMRSDRSAVAQRR